MDFPFSAIYNNVKNNCKGGKNMRKLYIDNIRWITVVLVVLYHVIYMFNGIETFGVIGPFSDVQYQDAFQYIVYPWFMLLLFVISGMSARYELVHRSEKEFIKEGLLDLLKATREEHEKPSHISQENRICGKFFNVFCG